MFQAAPFLYSGEEWINRYHGEHQEDNEAFQEVLRMADESKYKMIQGLMKYMESKNLDFEDMSRVNSLMQRFAIKINQFYVTF
jgi:cell division GTPase FtsZ